jgi:uncharacterized protein involved in exopolysaccharide biosynthesis
MFTHQSDGEGDVRGLTFRDLVTPIFRHKRAGILTAAVLFTVTAAATSFLPTLYEAEMKILVRRERVDPIVSADRNATSQGNSDVTENELNLEVELLKSRDLLEQVVLAAGLHLVGEPPQTDGHTAADNMSLSRAVQRLEATLKVGPIRKTTLIKVTYRASDAALAARVLKELSRLYLEKHLAVHRPPGAFQFFSAQAERFKTELSEAEGELKQFGRRESVVVAETEKDSTLQKLADFEAALQETRGTIADSTRRIAELEAQTDATPPRQTTQIRTFENVELMRELKSRILNLEVKRGDMLRKFAPTYPPVVELEQELTQARAALERTEGAPLTDETTDQNPTHQWLRSELARVKTERVASAARAAALANSVRVYREKAHELDEKDAAQKDLKRAMKSAEDTYLLYARKQEEARISDALDRTRIANVTVAQQPTVPSMPSSTGKTLLLTIGALMALVLGTAVTYLLDYLSPYFRTPDEVESLLQIPVLASLPAGLRSGMASDS